MATALNSASMSSLEKTPPSFFNIPGCDFTPTSLTIKHKLTFDHWSRLGDALKSAQSGIQWWLGDWMNYGEMSYGEKYSQAVDVHDVTGINVDTLRYYQHVAGKVPVVRRLTSLPWSHHQVVASLKDAEQTKWLKKAETEGLSYRELRREVEKEERTKNFKLVSSVLEKIWERIVDGCYTAEAISKCTECGNNIFGLELKEIELYMQQLVGSGRAEWRDQGGKTEVGRGSPTQLCVPKDMPVGSDFVMPGYRPLIEWNDEKE